ncbi:MAG: hypothetical protein AB1766_10435 [Pseudomonadota bacterium]
MSIVFLASVWMAINLLYLSSPNQRLMPGLSRAWLLRGSGLVLLTAGLGIGLTVYGVLTALLSAVVLGMLWFGLLPLLTLLRPWPHAASQMGRRREA